MIRVKQATKGSVTLKGSAELVKEYLDYAINGVLYQRGIYPAETFTTAEHFGITMYKLTDKNIIAYLKSVLEEIQERLVNREIQKVSLIIKNMKTLEVMERWNFKIEYEGNENRKTSSTKDIKTIQNEIRDVLRQICATVSFLPSLDCHCSFAVLCTGACERNFLHQRNRKRKIENAQDLQLRFFSTSFHKVHTSVRYKLNE